MNEARKYFIGIALSGSAKGTVDGLRARIAEKFGVKGALTSPPHITLFYPFETTDSERIANGLRLLAGSLAAFTVHLIGFRAFDEAVWFLEPVQVPALFHMKESVAAVVNETVCIAESAARRKTHFHITLAYKDVVPETHRRIAEFLRDEPLPVSSILVDNIVLFGRSADDKGWEPAEIFPLNGV